MIKRFKLMRKLSEMEGGIKLGTLFVDHYFHLVFERDIEAFELGHML
jgi:hypothetical protein